MLLNGHRKVLNWKEKTEVVGVFVNPDIQEIEGKA